MDVLFSHYIKGKIVSGAPAKEDATRSTLLSLIQSNHCTFAPADENGFRNDEELLFHMFVQLCSSSYSNLLDKVVQLEKENHILKVNWDQSCAENTKLQQELASLKQQQKDESHISSVLQKDYEIIRAEKAKLQQEFTDLGDQLKDSDGKAQLIQLKCDTLKTQNGKLQDEVSSLRQQLKNSKCKACPTYRTELMRREEKYQNLVKKMGQCALVANTSLESQGNILKRVRAILCQTMSESSDVEDDSATDMSLEVDFSSCPKNGTRPRRPVEAGTFERKSGVESGFVSQDAVVLAPDSICLDPDETVLPDSDCDVSLQHPPTKLPPGVSKEGEELRVIPETVPFDVEGDDQIMSTAKFFHTQLAPCSPITVKETTQEAEAKEGVLASPSKITTPVKKVKVCDAVPSLDQSYCSPTIFDLPGFSQPCIAPLSDPPAAATADVRNDVSGTEEEEDFPKRRLFRELIDPSKPIVEKRGPRPKVEPSDAPALKKSKPLKQTKLSISSFQNVRPTAEPPAQRPKIAMKVAPPNEYRESKRKRRGKEPEDWECKDCYRLLREAEAAGKIDRRKHDIAMNFCHVHFGRTSYYLNTPPGFWDCNKMRPPRNGHLNPLEGTDDDDDDFVKV